MTVYIQHSYGKSDRITQSIDKDLTAGIIFSPKGESSPEKMIETIDEYAKMNYFFTLARTSSMLPAFKK